MSDRSAPCDGPDDEPAFISPRDVVGRYQCVSVEKWKRIIDALERAESYSEANAAYLREERLYNVAGRYAELAADIRGLLSGLPAALPPSEEPSDA